jgi:hypothetical protein
MEVMSPKQNDQLANDGTSLASFADYKQAVSYVEKLIENDFPAKFVSIIGTDLKTIELVKGKLGYGRVSLSGALTGSWLGMFFGLIFGVTGSEQILVNNVLAGIIIGSGIGMLLNIVRFSVTKNKRGFVSGQTVVAKKYQVVVPNAQAQLAKKAVSASNVKPVKPAKKSS